MSTVVVVVAMLLSGCERPGTVPGSAATEAPATENTGQAPDPASGGPKPQGAGEETGCSSARARTGKLLPVSTESVTLVKENPCLPLAELADLALGLVEINKEQQLLTDEAFEIAKKNKQVFRGMLGTFATQLLVANDAAECGYETDRLAIAIYRQPEYLWSVGVVAVIRGDAGAVFDVTACTLLKQLPLPTEGGVRVSLPGPKWQMCSSFSRPNVGGETYTVVTVGDSDQMCRFLDRAA